MLDPRQRTLLFEALRPPDGYALHSAVGATYSLDLMALLAAPLRNLWSFNTAFIAAGVGLVVGTGILVLNWKKLAVADIQSEANGDDFGMKQILTTILLPAGVFGAVGYFVGQKLPFVINTIGPVTFAFIVGMLPIIAYFGMLVKKASPEEKPGLAALIPVYIAGGAFFMILHLSGGLMTVFAEHSTDRQAEWIPKATDFYAQKAMPSYFGNAGPGLPRPDERTLVIVDGETESMFGARILTESAVEGLTGDPDLGLTLGNVATVSEDERFFESMVFADEQVKISSDKDAHGVTTTSVKVVPENAPSKGSGVLTRTIDGNTVPVIPVSQETHDGVYRNTNADTSTLAPGKYVRLVNAEMITGLLNPVFVVLLTPVVVMFFAWRAKKGKSITTARKIFYGMVITAVSLMIMVIGAKFGQDGAIKTSMIWLAIYYMVITVGELCLSPMGLSLVTKLAPKRLVGLMMGGWFLSTSIGNKLSGFISGLQPTAQMFTILAVAILGVAAFLYALLPRLDSAIKKYGA